jgi:zinc/manganese transport system substrate-binding protein
VKRPAALAMVLLAAAGASACGGGGGDEAKPKPKLRVVATTPQVADFLRAVGGSRVQVDQLIPNTTPAHEYRPGPDLLKRLKDVDLVLRSGGELDAWLPAAAKKAGVQDRDVVDLSKAVVLREEDGRVDFHWWQDPRNVGAATLKIRDELIKRDADGSRPYRAAASRYRRRLARLDLAAARCIRETLAGVRKLFTTHESFGYFDARYGLEDAGAVLEGTTSPATDQAGDPDQLAARLKASGAIAIFPEHGFGLRRLIDEAAEKAGVRVGDELYADTLGRPESRDARYVGAFAHDVQSIAHGLGVPVSNCPLPRWP